MRVFGQGAALTAAAWAAAAANADGGGPFQRLGEGRGAALREAWTVEAVRTVPAERRAAAGDADELFTYVNQLVHFKMTVAMCKGTALQVLQVLGNLQCTEN